MINAGEYSGNVIETHYRAFHLSLVFVGGVYDAKLLHLLVQGERRMSSERLEDLRVAINSRGHLFVYTRTGSPQLTLGTERHC